MSVTLMAASCDSIGSCSLDVDAESLAESSQVEPPPANHRPAGDLDPNAASLSERTLHSLLLSDLRAPSPTPAPAPAAKKPSYLNLACSISGYGGITTYDSKLREGFRSRDHSPGPGKIAGISREASPARTANCGNLLSAPNTAGRLPWPNMKHASPGISATNGTDHTDAAANLKRLTQQRNKWLEATLSPPTPEKGGGFQNVVSVFETRSNGHHGLKMETKVENRYEFNTSSQSTVVSSTTVISKSNASIFSNNNTKSERIIPVTIEKDMGIKSYCRPSEDSSLNGVSNGSIHQSPVSTKSFIQQRVERLYGPCALAQGFFHRSCKNPTFSSQSSFGTNGFACQSAQDEQSATSSEKKASRSPELPVLRHLRPEFRDQLPVAPRRSLGSRIVNDLVAPKSSVLVQQTQLIRASGQLQHQASTESLADLQPAAPEVVLPQPPSSRSYENKSDLASTALVKEALVEQNLIAEENRNLKQDEDTGKIAISENEENVGHRFLRIQRQTIEKLLKLAERAEREIESSGKDGNAPLPEEALGHLRAAAGLARLLVTQKMVQFEGLCCKCISQSPDEPFPTTAEDLQGFWDMLLLQVEQVNNTFVRLDKLKAVGWSEDKLAPEESSCPDGAGAGGGAAGKRTPKASPAGRSAKAAAEAVAARRQRDEERRKMMEQRRRELKQKRSPAGGAKDEMVEIFGAQPS